MRLASASQEKKERDKPRFYYYYSRHSENGILMKGCKKKSSFGQSFFDLAGT